MVRQVGRLIACMLGLALCARATIVVDPAGGGHFTTLEEAIAAAADGEQILLESGTYQATAYPYIFVLDGKSLALFADTGAAVTLASSLKVTGLDSHQWVILRSLSATELIVEGAGAVWAEDCTFKGNDGIVEFLFIDVPFFPQPGADVRAAGSAVFQHCTLLGGRGFNAGFNPSLGTKWTASFGAPGVLVESGRVALQDCTVLGGNGGDGDMSLGVPWGPPDGGAGVEARLDAFASIAGSQLTGGSNGNNLGLDFDHPGAGVVLDFPSAGTIWLRDSLVQAGTIVGSGVSEPDVDVPPQYLTQLAAPSRSITVTSPLREGEVGTFTVHGQPGDQPLLLVALGAGFGPLPAKQGVFTLDTSLLLLPVALGTIIDPSGVLSVPFVTPQLNPVLLGLTVPIQLAVSAGGKVTLEGGTALAWVDSSL